MDDALVMGVFYACQTDLTLLAPPDQHHHDHAMDAHMAWIAGAPHLGERGGPPPQTAPAPFSVCSLLTPELLEAMEAREDRENFHTRGYGLSATRWVLGSWVWGWWSVGLGGLGRGLWASLTPHALPTL